MTDYLNPHRISANYPIVNRAGEIQTGRVDIAPGFDSVRPPVKESFTVNQDSLTTKVLRDEDGEIVGFWKEEKHEDA